MLLGLRAALFAGPRAEPVAYAKAVGGGCQAIRYDGPAGESFGATARSVEFELPAGALAADPARGDQLTAAGVQWRVANASHRPETASWLLTVERAP